MKMKMVFAWLALMAALITLAGCATKTKYVPMVTLRREYISDDTSAFFYRLLRLMESTSEKVTQSDSTFDREKETLVLKENGDTARHERERIIYRSTNREKELEHKIREQDSLINALRTKAEAVKVDSVPVPYPVEKNLTKWEKTKMDFGGMALGALLVVLCVAVAWLIKKFRK